MYDFVQICHNIKKYIYGVSTDRLHDAYVRQKIFDLEFITW